jgi:uncharacterized SAM-binding protein YcdF (DUF218 family)
VILLSGSIEVARTGARDQLVLNDAAERFTAFLDLARKHPEARLVSTGGGWARVGSVRMSEAELAVEHLARLGLPRERILVETRSRNTAENAAFARALVEPRPGERWLLVTSAWHMPRAVGSFRRAGFPVTAHPVDYRTAGTPDRVGPAEGLRRLDVAAKEWLGLAVYHALGRTDALFPEPEGARPSGPHGAVAAGP